jgi:hypothetical protein
VLFHFIAALCEYGVLKLFPDVVRMFQARLKAHGRKRKAFHDVDVGPRAAASVAADDSCLDESDDADPRSPSQYPHDVAAAASVTLISCLYCDSPLPAACPSYGAFICSTCGLPSGLIV